MRSMADLRTWRDLRRKRREREAMLLDLGALVYELHRQGGARRSCFRRRRSSSARWTSDVRALEDALEGR